MGSVSLSGAEDAPFERTFHPNLLERAERIPYLSGMSISSYSSALLPLLCLNSSCLKSIVHSTGLPFYCEFFLVQLGT